jgi:hypothetical protein
MLYSGFSSIIEDRSSTDINLASSSRGNIYRYLLHLAEKLG